MTRYPPGFFLDPPNWWALPQSPDLPAYPWTPSREIAQTIITGDDEGAIPNGNVAQGLLDFDRFGSPPIGTLNMSPQSALLGVPPMSGGVGNAADIPQFTPGRAPFASRFQTMSPFGASPIGATQNAAGRIVDAQETTGAGGSPNATPQQALPTSGPGYDDNGGYARNTGGGRYGYGHAAPNTAGSGRTLPEAPDTSERKGLIQVQQQPMNTDFARAMIGIIDATQGKLADGPAGQAAFANGSTYETNPDGSHLVKEGTVVSVTADGRGFATTGSPQNGTMVLVKPDGSVTLLRGPL